MNGLIAQVTQIMETDQILAGCDPDICSAVQQERMDAGIEVLCQTRVQAIEPSPAGFQLMLTGSTSGCRSVDTVVYASDRVVNLDTLNLDAIGVAINSQGIPVNEYSQTTISSYFCNW